MLLIVCIVLINFRTGAGNFNTETSVSEGCARKLGYVQTNWDFEGKYWGFIDLSPKLKMFMENCVTIDFPFEHAFMIHSTLVKHWNVER